MHRGNFAGVHFIVLFNIFIKELDDGPVSLLIKFADDTILGGTDSILESRNYIQNRSVKFERCNGKKDEVQSRPIGSNTVGQEYSNAYITYREETAGDHETGQERYVMLL